MLSRLYTYIAVWASISLLISVLVKSYGLVAYVVVFVGLFGGVFIRYRSHIVGWLRNAGWSSTPKYVLLISIITLIEEWLVLVLAGRAGLMYPGHFGVNMLLVLSFLVPWLLTWKLYLLKQYRYSKNEAIMTAGLAGVMYEVLNPARMMNPAAWLMLTPLSILIYAVVAYLPLQVIEYSGRKQSRIKYLVSVLLLFVVSWGPALLVFMALSVFGVSLE